VRYIGEVSTILDINASIIQGSALGPVSYNVVNAGDLTTVTRATRYTSMRTTHIFLYQPVTFIHVKLKSTMSLTGHRLII